MRPLRLAGALLGALVLAACTKDAIQVDDITAPVTGARVKFFNFGQNAPQVNFYANDTKVSAISSTTGVEATTGVAYGAVASGNLYVNLAPGAYTFSGRIAAATDKDLPIATIAQPVVAGRAYSVYLAGVYDATTKRVDGFAVEDQFADSIDYSQAYVRFVNASPNSTPMQLFVRNPTTLEELPVSAASGVAFKAAGAFTPVPANSYDLVLRAAGSSTVFMTRTAQSFVRGRIYSITLRGDMTISPTGTATNRPFLDNSLNR